jgi:tetratricopeptide (TPR) repeat protein
MVGIDDAVVTAALSAATGIAGMVRRAELCLGVFAVTVVGGFLGLNLIRVVSDRVKAEIQREVSGQVEPLRLLEKGKMLMEEQSYEDALDAFRSLARQDRSLLPIVWRGRALKRMGCVAEAIEVLSEGLRQRAGADDRFRRAVALWNLGCYRAILGPSAVRAVIEALDQALRNAPQFRESLTAEALDEDLASLLGNPIFEEWRKSTLARRDDDE